MIFIYILNIENSKKKKKKKKKKKIINDGSSTKYFKYKSKK